jgi:hypothetical protein
MMRAPSSVSMMYRALDIGSTVCADDLPIGAARKNPPVELWPAHTATEDADDTPLAIGCAAETGDALELCENRENGLLSQHDGNPLEPQLLTGGHLTLPVASRKYGTQPGSHLYGAYYLARRSHQVRHSTMATPLLWKASRTLFLTPPVTRSFARGARI